MQKIWIETNAVLTKCIFRKFVQSNKASLMTGILAVTEVDISKLSKFKTKDEKTEYAEKLEVWEQEEHQNTNDDYKNFSSNKNVMLYYKIV